MAPSDPIKLFIGSGEASLLERKTLIYSLHKHTKRKLDIYVFNGTHNSVEHNQHEPFPAPLPLKLKYLNGTTEFGLYRYLLSQVCQFQGKAIYLDSDIVCLTDIGELWDAELSAFDLLALANSLPETGKLLYRTSVMLIDCARFRLNLQEVVEQVDRGLYALYPDFFHMSSTFLLHHPYRIGNLDPRWNSLDRCDRDTKAIHYTRLSSQPWKYYNHPYGELWFNYFYEAVAAGYINQADIDLTIERAYVRRDIVYGNFWYQVILNQCIHNASEFLSGLRRHFIS